MAKNQEPIQLCELVEFAPVRKYLLLLFVGCVMERTEWCRMASFKLSQWEFCIITTDFCTSQFDAPLLFILSIRF
jgi:hypothetical protein